MKRGLFKALIIVLFFNHLISCKQHNDVLYTFDNIPDRVWCGEEFWTVPLEGWRMNNGRVECISNIQHATFSVLPYVLTEKSDGFRVLFDMGMIERGENDGSAGITIGRKAIEEDDVRASVYFGQGINMGINTQGYAFIEQQTSRLPSGFDFSSFKVEVTGGKSSGEYLLSLGIKDKEGNNVAELSFSPEEPVSGILQLVNNFRSSSSSNNGPNSGLIILTWKVIKLKKKKTTGSDRYSGQCTH
jgi:alkaline phosphatase D